MKRITLVCILCGCWTILPVLAATNTLTTVVKKTGRYPFDAYWLDEAHQWKEDSTHPGLKWTDLPDTAATLSKTGAVLLATLTRRETWRTSIITPYQAKTADVRRELFKANILPVWNGSAWVDGNLLAANGYDLSEKCAHYLRELNYREYYMGYSSIPPDIRKEVTLNGEAWAYIGLSRRQLFDAGYTTGFDTNTCIWRISGKVEMTADETKK